MENPQFVLGLLEATLKGKIKGYKNHLTSLEGEKTNTSLTIEFILEELEEMLEMIQSEKNS
jgi:hypothetical protein